MTEATDTQALLAYGAGIGIAVIGLFSRPVLITGWIILSIITIGMTILGVD